MIRLTVRIHDLEQGETALAIARELTVEVQLASAPHAAGYAGVAFLKALGEALGRPVIADCGEAPGLVMAGLREGLRDLQFTGEPAILCKLQDMARQTGACVVASLAGPVVELEPQDGPFLIRRKMVSALQAMLRLVAAEEPPPLPQP